MEIMKLLEGRRTYRRFDQSRPLPEEVLQDMANAARLASSARNAQVLRFVFVTQPEAVEAVFGHVHFAGALPPELGQPKEGQHPTAFVIMTCAHEDAKAMTYTDAGLAASNITLAAYAQGVGSCIMGAIDRPQIKEILQIPDDQDVLFAIALGYPTHTAVIEPMPEDGSFKYWLDDDRNYHVPKRSLDDLVRRV